MVAMSNEEAGAAAQATFEEWRLQEVHERPKRIVAVCIGIAGAIAACAFLLMSAPK